jgi:hypothetical protein
VPRCTSTQCHTAPAFRKCHVAPRKLCHAAPAYRQCHAALARCTRAKPEMELETSTDRKYHRLKRALLLKLPFSLELFTDQHQAQYLHTHTRNGTRATQIHRCTHTHTHLCVACLGAEIQKLQARGQGRGEGCVWLRANCRRRT